MSSRRNPPEYKMPEDERKRLLQEAMEKGAAERIAGAWDRLKQIREEMWTALTYARDAELHKMRVSLDVALDDEHRKRLYAGANKLLRGGETKRRPGSKRRDMELLLAVIAGELDGTDEELARKIIGVLPDLGLLPGDFVFNPDDVSRIAPLIAPHKRRTSDSREKSAKRIARAVLVDGFGADKAKIDDLFE
jgi:hypothetical protein